MALKIYVPFWNVWMNSYARISARSKHSNPHERENKCEESTRVIYLIEKRRRLKFHLASRPFSKHCTRPLVKAT